MYREVDDSGQVRSLAISSSAYSSVVECGGLNPEGAGSMIRSPLGIVFGSTKKIFLARMDKVKRTVSLQLSLFEKLYLPQ